MASSRDPSRNVHILALFLLGLASSAKRLNECRMIGLLAVYLINMQEMTSTTCPKSFK